MTHPFDPDWCIHPGTTIAEFMKESSLDHPAMLLRTGITGEQLEGLLSGQLEIDPALASALSRGTGASAQFWLNLDHHFRTDLDAGKSWTNRPEPAPPTPESTTHP